MFLSLFLLSFFLFLLNVNPLLFTTLPWAFVCLTRFTYVFLHLKLGLFTWFTGGTYSQLGWKLVRG